MTTVEPLAGLTVFERGWLSANNILFVGDAGTALVDSGYCSHAEQTVALVQRVLGKRPLDRLVNTHLHSDHCGGNAALRSAWPEVRTLIPPGQAQHVRDWDPEALSYTPTGQHCPRFRIDDVLVPGSAVRLGDDLWQVHAAPGHDPHSVVLFEPASRTLISADALWQNGFGVVFPEIDSEDGFGEVAATLDLIESLGATTVIPGHGAVFIDVAAALSRARRRLDGFVQNPDKHATHAAKVLLKFKLLELQRVSLADFMHWALGVRIIALLHGKHFSDVAYADWIGALLDDLVRSRAATRDGDLLVNAP